MGMLIDGVWSDEDQRISSDTGAFVRPESPFRRFVTADPGAEFPAEPRRYHLYVNLGCPWAYRTVLYRAVKRLDDAIPMTLTRPDAGPEGWTFDDEYEDDLLGCDHLHQVYARAANDFTGRVTVPVLWDTKTETIVSNESSEIIRMLNSEFDAWGDPELDFYPAPLREEIDAINEVVYTTVNNGVYRAGFARTQEAYEEAFDRLFETLDELESRLDRQRYLVGRQVTEADWRLFSTLVRFDVAYYSRFKCNLRRIVDYPNLWAYTRDLYQFPRVAETVDLEHIKRIYYQSRNPDPTLPKGPALDFAAPHDRARLA